MYIFIAIAILSALVAAIPQSQIRDVKPNLVLSGPPSILSNHTYTPDEVHENTMKNHPAKWILTSDALAEYLPNNIGANHTIYVSDQQKWISMLSVKAPPSSGVSKREAACLVSYQQHWTAETQSWWASWLPASGCQYTGLDGSGGTNAIMWSFSIAITENASLDWSIIKDVLSASVGFSVAETWVHGGSNTCNIPGSSVGQIWEQNYIAWGWFWSEGCCGGCCGAGCGGYDPRADGGATAPRDSTTSSVGVNIGCSTGFNNVQC